MKKKNNKGAVVPKRGGKRPGAGRKQKQGEATTTVAFRVPISRANELKELVKAKLLEWSKPTS